MMTTLPTMAVVPRTPNNPRVTRTFRPDGGVSSAKDFNSWLTTIPNGSILDLEGFEIDATQGSVQFVDRQDLVIYGGRTVQFDAGLYTDDAKNRAPWRFDRCQRLTLVGTRAVGNNTGKYYAAYEEQAGFYFRRTKDVSLVECSAEGVYGDGVCLAHENADSSREPCQGISVLDFKVEGHGRNAVAVVDAVDVFLSKIYARGGRSAVNVEPPAPAMQARRVWATQIIQSGTTYPILANRGGSNAVSDISLTDSCRLDGPIRIDIRGRSDRPGTRERYYLSNVFQSPGLTTLANGVPVSISLVNDVIVTGIDQPCAGFLQLDADSSYPGIGIKAVSVNRLDARNNPLLRKGTGAKPTGDFIPVFTEACTDVTQ